MEVNADLPSLLSESTNQSTDKSSSASRDSLENNGTLPETPKPTPMAFTIDFGGGKAVDKSRLEHLAKQSQARHQRVQSMSGTLQRTNPIAVTPQQPPMSAKLPRKAQGYNSEGYFSSDQEDSLLSCSLMLRQSPLAQKHDCQPHSLITSPIFDKTRKPLHSPTQKSKSPIVDSILSRSDTLPSRQGLNLPLKSTITGSYHNINTPNSNFSYNTRQLNFILDQSPDGLLLTDVSSPELDVITPDNVLSSPEHKSSIREIPDLFKKCIANNELEILEDIDRHSDSSTGTYTIEADYSEEQKSRMSIDRTFGVDLLRESTKESLQRRSISKERDPELIIDSRESSSPNRFEMPRSDNVLQINCFHEPSDLADQTSKQIKSTRNYLEKIKSRVRTISEKTFHKPSKPATPQDEGSFTSVTACGVLAKTEYRPRKLSLSKSKIDQTEYIHHLTRESSVPVSLPSEKRVEPAFESTVLRKAHANVHNDSGIADSPDQIVGKLSHLSLNRCKGDQTWIQDWAESVKKYNNDTMKDLDGSFLSVNGEKPPASPKHQLQKSTIPMRAMSSSSTTKIPSPISSSFNSPRTIQDPSGDTSSYLLKTQNAISNLQAKLHTKPGIEPHTSSQMASSFISERVTPSKLPVSQLSRSNSLNYRLKRKDHDSPLRSPGHYVITGSSALRNTTKLLFVGASRSFDAPFQDSNINSPTSERTISSEDKTLSNKTYAKHSRNRSFDGKNPHEHFNCDNAKVSLKTVLKNNAFEAQNARIEPTTCFQGDIKHSRVFGVVSNIGGTIKRSSSFSTVNKNNNYIQTKDGLDYSDESDCTKAPEVRYNRTMALRRDRFMSPELKNASSNSSRCPNTPEMTRKFGPGSVRTTVRSSNKDRLLNRASEPRMSERDRTPCQGKRLSESARNDIVNRLTKSRSSTREIQPKKLEKVSDKTSRQRSASSLAREAEYNNWKRRSTYDPLRGARQARCGDGVSPSHSSPVHRSQSFHSTNLADLEALDYSSEDEQGPTSNAVDSIMVTSTHSEILRPNLNHTFHINKPSDNYRRDSEKRKTFILDDTTVKNRSPFIDKRSIDKRDTDKRKACVEEEDKRRTFILDSDTNSTTNGSSPRNSSIFSHEKTSLTTGPSDTEGESGTESAPVVLRQGRRANSSHPAKRHSGDYSMSSSTTSVARDAKRPVQPRYLDISRYKSEPPAAPPVRKSDSGGKGSARSIEMEQKKAELEKWKRRASYDPRKAAAAAKTNKLPQKTASSVLRSQSFHGPVSAVSRYVPSRHIPEYGDDYTSDNDF